MKTIKLFSFLTISLILIQACGHKPTADIVKSNSADRTKVEAKKIISDICIQ
jgi:hypothetical protein